MIAAIAWLFVARDILWDLFPPIRDVLSYLAYSALPINIPSPEAVLNLRARGLIDDNTFLSLMRMHGFDASRSALLLELHKARITSEALLVLKWRGEISEEEFERYRRLLGWDEEDWEKFERAHKYFPTPSDLIRFSVREVWKPDVVAKYGYDQEFPEEFARQFARIGGDREIARWYWRAHWDLPSLTQGYEMLQRLAPDLVDYFERKYKRYSKMGLKPEDIKTDLDTLRDLIRIQDIAPYWRDRLIAISYAPLTRVDLRRMYDLALIDREELVMRLREWGYSPADAEKLAIFYSAYTWSRILRNMYRKGWIDEHGVREKLLQLGVPRERVDEWVKEIVRAEKPARTERERDLTKSEIIKGVAKGILTPEQGKKMLMRLGYDEWEAQYLLYLYGAYEGYFWSRKYEELREKGASDEEIRKAWERWQETLKNVVERLRTGAPVGSLETDVEYEMLEFLQRATVAPPKVPVPDMLFNVAQEVKAIKRELEEAERAGDKKRVAELRRGYEARLKVLKRMWEEFKARYAPAP